MNHAHRRPPAAPAAILMLLALGLATAPLAAQEFFEEPEEAREEGAPRLDWGLEGKAHFRESDGNRFPISFMFAPNQLPVGQETGFLETVNEGTHLEVSTLTLFLEAGWGESVTARAKIDFIDLYDRNPTSEDRSVDVDEAWLRFGREMPPAQLPERSGAYLKIGKFGKFERQDDRHLESYGLVSTAFNRFEDTGLEIGVDLGRHLYLKGSLTQGNPLFIRDPNALAGDNGIPLLFTVDNPDPELKSGVVILYDAEVEDLDVDGELETGLGLGLRFGDGSGRRGVDLLLWAYERELADTVDLEGTLYGGDLDLLLGPLNAFPLPISGRDKEEVGANLWLYRDGFSFFGQYVDQEVAGLTRTGFEVEVAWRFELPLKWAVAGRQLFPYIAPAARFSRLEPEFEGGSRDFPAPSVRWEWDKLDLGLRLGVIEGVDLTLEYAGNTFVRAGRDEDNDELLATLRWRFGAAARR